jgi:hypothetical protein
MSPQISKNNRYCTGQELVDAWGIHPSHLSLCMILGLQPYAKKDLRPVFDPKPQHITEDLRDTAWRTLRELTNKEGPKRFQGSDPPDHARVDWMHYRLFDSVSAAVTIDELIRQHLDCLFRTADALKFQREFGLGRNADVDRVFLTETTTQPEKSEKPQGNKEKIRTYARGAIAADRAILRLDLAMKIKGDLPVASAYEPEYIIDMIRDLFPDYTGLKPGRKKGR